MGLRSWALAIFFGCCCFLRLLPLMAQDPVAATNNPPADSANNGTAALSDPDADRVLSLLKEAPPHLLRLIDRGKVRWSFDDRPLKEARKQGLTKFQYEVGHRAQFRYRWLASSGSQYRLAASIAYQKLSFEMKHEIILSEFFSAQGAWKSRLLLHEFDHICISTDPRVASIAEDLFFGRERLEVVVDAEGYQQQVQKKIEEEILEKFEERKAAFGKMLQAAYDRLDALSQHGLQPIEDRKKLFSELFSHEFLKAIEGFPLDRIDEKSLEFSPAVEMHYEPFFVP
ncbi:MAG: hypothetical protein ACK57Y_08675 [Pirellulaceae bacterium]